MNIEELRKFEKNFLFIKNYDYQVYKCFTDNYLGGVMLKLPPIFSKNISFSKGGKALNTSLEDLVEKQFLDTPSKEGNLDLVSMLSFTSRADFFPFPFKQLQPLMEHGEPMGKEVMAFAYHLYLCIYICVWMKLHDADEEKTTPFIKRDLYSLKNVFYYSVVRALENSELREKLPTFSDAEVKTLKLNYIQLAKILLQGLPVGEKV